MDIVTYVDDNRMKQTDEIQVSDWTRERVNDVGESFFINILAHCFRKMISLDNICYIYIMSGLYVTCM